MTVSPSTTPAINGKMMLWIALWLLGVSSVVLGPFRPACQSEGIRAISCWRSVF